MSGILTTAAGVLLAAYIYRNIGDSTFRKHLFVWWVVIPVIILGVLFVIGMKPASAFHTQCTVKSDTLPVSRPDGEAPPRWDFIKGKAVIMDIYGEWVFVMLFAYKQELYGWVKRDTLSNCKVKDGTP